jgi:hypothetical protein
VPQYPQVLFKNRKPDRVATLDEYRESGGYRALEKLHIPGQGYSNVLPKYASATGGEVLSEYSRTAIEGVYQQLIGDARNQYTLGYVTRATPSDTRRDIEVRVARPGCKSSDLRPCVNVYAKAGYYPLPAGR